MTGHPPSPCRVHIALRWALLSALLWAGALAPGVMLARGPNGSVTFVPCHSAALRLVSADAHGQHAHDQRAPAGEDVQGDEQARLPTSPCVFAAVHAPATPSYPFLWSLPNGTAKATVSPLRTVGPAPEHVVLADHLPRGPPVV